MSIEERPVSSGNESILLLYDLARTIVDQWNQLQNELWSEQWFDSFYKAIQQFNKTAESEKSVQLIGISMELQQLLKQISAKRIPNSKLLERLNNSVMAIAQECSRANHAAPVKHLSGSRNPVYICVTDKELAINLKQQLELFSVLVILINSELELEELVAIQQPAAFLVDTKFGGDGADVISSIQKQYTAPIPVVFVSPDTPSIQQRISVVRANGVALFEGQVEFDQLVEILTGIISINVEPPFKVLVVDDSKLQSIFAEKMLNSAGVFTRSISQPLEILNVLDTFRPDAILMDFYMPDCNGSELSRVIRQQSRYDGIPIIFLSSESDISRQLDAVANGGDDFLTKPIQEKVLVSTVLSRCRRYRGLRDQMSRDSLTNLLDHNNTLEALQTNIEAMREKGKPLSFAMVDIDHLKSVNDTYGHAMGDRVIHALALYLRQRFRLSDVIGRYGGEEFAVVLPDTDIEQAQKLMDKVRLGFSKLILQSGEQKVQVTFSCGVTSMKEDDNVNFISQRADKALYKAKAEGRNRVEFL